MIGGERDTSHKVNKAFDVFDKLGGTNSKNEKVEIIESETGNEVLKLLFTLCYNPYIQYYVKNLPKISSFAVSTSWEVTYGENYLRFINLLGDLSTRKVTGHAALQAIKDFGSSISQVEWDWYARVIQKDLKLGVASKTINTAYDTKMVPSFSCTLAHTLDADKPWSDQLPDRYIVEPKLDGMRMLAFHHLDGRVELKTRNGKLLFGFDELEEHIKANLKKGMVYDGELMSEQFGLTVEANKLKFQKTQYLEDSKVELDEAFNELMTQAFQKSSNKTGVYNMFDCLDLESFEKEAKTQDNLLQRKQDLLEQSRNFNSKILKVVEHRGIFHSSDPTSEETLKKLHKYNCFLGYEGSMIKAVDAPYIFKRTKSLLKLKPMHEIDLEVVGVEEGTGRNKGKMGAVVVEYKGNTVNVGSGFTDAQREIYWLEPNEIVGKTIEILYQNESSNKQGTKSLRFPTFVRIREDK